MELFWCDLRGLESYSPSRPGRSAAPGSGWAWSLLSYAVRAVWGCDLPEADTLPGGKPFFPSRPEICFSLSHTKTAVLAAVSEYPVGADVEWRRPVRPSFETRLFSLPHGDLDVFELWTLRESWFKLTGEGSLLSIPFSRENGVITGPSPELKCRVYDEIPASCAAVCSLSETPSKKILRVAPEEIMLEKPSGL